MKQYFRCELKKLFYYFLATTAVLTIGYIVWLSIHTKALLADNSGMWIVYFGLILLAFFNPIIVYSFKMNRCGVDEYYALPIKREKLYMVKTLVGICLTLVPFTVAYWCGAVFAFCRMGATYQIQWYALGYPMFLLLGIALFGINAFVFTRANAIIDGILFMAAYAFIGAFIVAYVVKAAHIVPYWWIDEGFLSWGAISLFGNFINDLVTGSESAHCTWWVFLYPLVAGTAGFIGLFVGVKKEKAENAEQISDCWLCYKLLIPIFTALSIGVMPFTWLGFALTAVGSVVAIVIYRRTVLFSWKYWLMMGIGIVVGVALMFLVGALAPPIVNPPEFA